MFVLVWGVITLCQLLEKHVHIIVFVRKEEKVSFKFINSFDRLLLLFSFYFVLQFIVVHK